MSVNEQIEPLGDLRCFGSICETLRCFWKLENFSSLDQTVGKFCFSSPIPSVEERNVSWRMVLHPIGMDAETEGTTLCGVVCANGLNMGIRAKITLSVRNSNLECIYSSHHQKWVVFRPGLTFERLEVPRASFLGDLTDDVLIITAEITYTRSQATSSRRTRNLSAVSPVLALAEDYRSLQERMEHDVVIYAGGTEIDVHRAVLCARSEVFAAVLENNPGRIQIDDFDADQVMAMVQFMYSLTVDDLNVPFALDLLRIGDKYEVYDLISYCTNFLAAYLDESNVETVLLAVDALESCDVIRAEAIEFICAVASPYDWERKFPSLDANYQISSDIFVRMKQLQYF